MLSDVHQTHYHHVWADQHSISDLDTILQEFAAECFITAGLEVQLEERTTLGTLVFSACSDSAHPEYDSRLFLHGAT